MPRNIEIKARVEDLETVRPVVAALADRGPVNIVQDDTFFRCDQGRLKLRAFSENRGELIFYQRSNAFGPKESFYVISPTTSPETLRDALARAYGEAGRVRKHRTLFLIGRTRVHLDEVEGLGAFVELEVVLTDTDDADSGIREAHVLMARLGIAPSQLIDGAYVDLVASNGTSAVPMETKGLDRESDQT